MENKKSIPENFCSVITDFTKDLSTTFPEYSNLWSKWTNLVDEAESVTLFNYCMTVYPERFFDILYQNADIFKKDCEINTCFLPNVDFKILFHCDNISETTKKTMWKYLQLVLFTVINNVKDKSTFGDTINMFEGINENDLHEKLKETMSGITDFFKNVAKESDESKSKSKSESESESGFEMPAGFDKMFESFQKNMEKDVGADAEKGTGLPNMENIHEHLKTLFDGKIGSLAKEMAEEISHDFSDLLGDDIENMQNPGEAVKQLMKNPKKIMDLMKTIGGKLDKKMQSGEISRDEIMKEATDMIGKMKDMGGVDQFKEMFQNLSKNMGGMAGMAGMANMAGMAANMAGMGKNMKMDTNALDRMTKQQSTRERLLKKMELKKQQAEQNSLRTTNTPYSLQSTTQPNNFVFKLDNENAQEKTYIHPDILAEMEKEALPKTSGQTKNKKKKSKK